MGRISADGLFRRLDENEPSPMVYSGFLLLSADPVLAAFGGICGRRDGCGNSSNDFRIFGSDPAPALNTPAQQATNINNEGVTLERQGNLEAALQKYQQALALNPSSQVIQENVRSIRARIANDRGLSAFKRGDFGAAAAAFREALSQKPGDPNLTENLRQAEAGREEEQRRASMQQGFSRMADILNSAQPAVTSGLDFDGGSRGTPSSSSSGGLDFLPATPTPQTVSASKPAAGSGCGVNTYASVVDLCGMGDKLVVDPAKLKAPTAVASAPQPPIRRSQRRNANATASSINSSRQQSGTSLPPDVSTGNMTRS